MTVKGDTVVADNAVAPGKRGANGTESPAVAEPEMVKLEKSVASKWFAAMYSPVAVKAVCLSPDEAVM